MEEGDELVQGELFGAAAVVQAERCEARFDLLGGIQFFERGAEHFAPMLESSACQLKKIDLRTDSRRLFKS